MKIKTILFTILSLTCVAMAHAQNAKPLMTEFEQALKGRAVRIETISCDFLQTRSMSVFAEDVRRRGHFTYKRPGNILLAFESGDYIVMTESVFAMRNGTSVTSVKTSSNPMMQQLKRVLSACMTGEMEQVTAGFSVDVDKADGNYRLTLSPLRGKAASHMQSLVMTFDIKDMSLASLRMDEPSGDYTLYEFSDKHFNEAVDDNIFKKR